MKEIRRSRTDLSRVQSRAIAWLRLPLAAGVVFIHAYGRYPALPAGAGAEAFRLLRELLSRVLPSVAVPAFFLLSGYLFFFGAGRLALPVYLRKLRRRWHTLAVPYLLWNALALLVYWADRNLSAWLSGAPHASVWQYFERRGGLSIFWCSHTVGHDGTNWLGLPAYALTAPIDVPLWFVRELMVLALLAPVIGWLLRRMRWTFPALLFLLYINNVWLPLPGLSVTALLFYTAGAAIAVGGKGLLATFRPWRRVWHCAAPLLVALLLLPEMHLPLPELHSLLRQLLSAGFVVAAFGALLDVASRLAARRRTRIPVRLASSAFFVYAAHTLLVLHAVDKWLRGLLPVADTASCLLRYLLCPLLTLLLCVAADALLRRMLPRLHRLLTGAR